MNGVIIAGFVMLLAVAPLALFGDPRLAAGLACCLAALALWRAAALQERERLRRARPADAATVVRQLSAWLVQRRREPIASERALARGREYATGVQDGAYATLDGVIDRLAETLRMLPPTPGTRPVSAGKVATARRRAAKQGTRAMPTTAEAQPQAQIKPPEVPHPHPPESPEDRPWRPPELRRSAQPGAVPTRTP